MSLSACPRRTTVMAADSQALIVDLDALHRLRQVAERLGASAHAAHERLDVVVLLDLNANFATAVQRRRFDVLCPSGKPA
ncbi:MAG: hypothetical protein ACREYE_31985 [Gammaproteobacteria bacterium]